MFFLAEDEKKTSSVAAAHLQFAIYERFSNGFNNFSFDLNFQSEYDLVKFQRNDLEIKIERYNNVYLSLPANIISLYFRTCIKSHSRFYYFKYADYFLSNYLHVKYAKQKENLFKN